MKIETTFTEAFGAPATLVRFTPGRVNLIGEHTDYNGGFVLPTALELGVHTAIRAREDDIIRVASVSFEDIAVRTLGDPASGHWADYAVGAVTEARRAGWITHGVDVALSSTLPIGSGLSSSSAVIVGVLKLLRDLQSITVSNVDLAIMARRVETDFIGMPCGIMDQMAIVLARPGEALFLNTHTLAYDLITLPDDPVIAVLHSGVHRSLAEGRYKERKEECDRIKDRLGREDICRATMKDVDAIADPRLRRRARHLVSEQTRTQQVANALTSNDTQAIGPLMIASHNSMRDDFEITTPELDLLVATAVREGALGARMTGGGFGGCIVALVPRARLLPWRDAVLKHHPQAFHVA
ncbi:galactokinase [Algimonas arctica]|uniref:Galactokinase n=1 Tax=Algimonas arctica TaxID=1479486 RepID=A0A8J3G1C6_9PROT|nr:galactokinase [Algimonas arctica]GHA84817.1 galactokinase [Algimonas arctica]